MHLAYSIAEFLRQLEESPDKKPSAGLVAWLRAQARRGFEGAFVALHAPMAPFTWETFVDLHGAERETGRVAAQFRGPVEIVGFFPTVVPIRPVADPLPAGQVLATPDDVLVNIDANEEDRYTNTKGEGQTSTAIGQLGAFVTLSSLAAQGNPGRLTGICLRNASPDLGFTYRWKQPPPAVAPFFFPDVIIGMAMFCRYLDRK
jgi:hypothetical protein